MSYSTALVITTYNRPDALDIVLESVKSQTVMPDEIIIADDGSGKETEELVGRWKHDETIGHLIRHVWQPDEGFKLSAIRNRAIVAAKSEYIIQIDGDIMLHPRFIEDHKRIARPGYMVNGSRVRLGKELSEEICRLHATRKLGPLSKGILKDRTKAVRLLWLSGLFLDHFKPHKYFAIGCNLAFWRKDAIAVNGFDETFKGWGHEDSDFLFRLSRIGIKKCDLRYAAIQFHLYHQQRGNGADNLAVLRKRNEEGIIKAIKGIDQYL